MSSLYGNIKKIASSTFQFDRVYSTRKAMDDAATTDGVYAGRYVLVEYGERYTNLLDNETVITYQLGKYVKVLPNLNYDETFYYFIRQGNILTKYEYTNNTLWLNDIIEKDILQKLNTYAAVNFVDNQDGTSTMQNIAILNPDYLENSKIDLLNYGSVYDSTVWQKVFLLGKDKYVMVAELNALIPKINIAQEMPITFESNPSETDEDGILTGKFNSDGELTELVKLTNVKERYNTFHFDSASDTNLPYTLRTPTTLKVKINKNSINIHEKGFDPLYHYSLAPDNKLLVAWIPEGLDNYTVNNNLIDEHGILKATLLEDTSIDTKVLYADLTAFGNTMDTLYNILYGMPDTNAPTNGNGGYQRPFFQYFNNTNLGTLLSNNTTGLATTLASIFKDVDPLTNSIKYYLFSDWTLKNNSNGSGPAIVNKPLVIGGYEQENNYVLGAHVESFNNDSSHGNGSRADGYWRDLSTEDNIYNYISYPHTDIIFGAFSGGDYEIDFNTWLLIRRSEISINPNTEEDDEEEIVEEEIVEDTLTASEDPTYSNNP